MFLLNTLDLVESGDPEHPRTIGLKNARCRTKAFLKEKYDLDVNDESLELKKELALCPFTKSNSSGGITFAHKTVYEYFTAVKLYEDYFAQFSTRYFQKTKPQTEDAAKAVVESYIDAFRYRWIPKEIFSYLNSMHKLPFYGNEKVSAGCFDTERFLQAFVYGMEKSILSRVEVKAPVTEYNYWSDPVSVQFNRAFQNFTWFLTGHGFKNGNNIDACKRIRDLLTLTDTEVNLAGWDLSGADLHGTNLSQAVLNGTDLSNTKLFNADLSQADLYGADLSGSDLSEAFLNKANLSGAELTGAVLREALLYEVNLSGVDLRDVNCFAVDLIDIKYCTDDENKTIFPAGFNKERYSMIEVDKNGTPVML